jgi:hypothetical protein
MAKLSMENTDSGFTVYLNGQMLLEDKHFFDHIDHEIPIQIYCGIEHSDIGFIELFCSDYVKVNNMLYNRDQFTFISRPGY